MIEKASRDKTISDFLDLSLFAIAGAFAGITFGWWADTRGLVGNPYAEGVTRLLAGAGDSIGEILYISWLRFVKKRRSAAEPYVFGKILGMMTGPIFQFGVIKSGMNPYGLAGVIYAVAYSNFDNLFGSIVFLISRIRLEKSFKRGVKNFWQQPYQVGNLFAVALIASVSFGVRLTGFSPVMNLSAGIEAGLMDVDSIIASLWAWGAYLIAGGAATIIFLYAAHYFGVVKAFWK